MQSSNRLLPVDPIGLGTPEVESISSFFLRLSEMNGASPNQIVEWVCAKNAVPEITLSVVASQPVALIRPTTINRTFCAALAQSTGFSFNTISRMTYLSLTDIVNRHHGCFDKRFRWCTACLSESARSGTESYFRLFWAFTGLGCCPIHRTTLDDKCPICGAHQDGWRAREILQFCIACGADLSLQEALSPTHQSWEFDGTDIVELTEFISKGDGNQFAKDGPRHALRAAFDNAWMREEELEYYKKLPRDECLSFLHCDKPITLTTARRLALRTGIPLVDMLCGIGIENSRELRPDWREQLPDSLAPKLRRPRIDIEGIRRKLDVILLQPQRPALRKVARQLDVSPGGLYYHLPEQCKMIVGRYKTRLSDEKLVKAEHAKQAIRAAIADWRRERFDNPTKKGLLKRLFPSSGVPKNLLREEISKTVDAL